ncbi:unnamed protein product [Vitrella brassicaformis CCMP3155]|uniref:AP complex subunit beta n=2 Tax=Vitrella brassicaformis TaxID=1169539 RepID=A0A0G4EHS5_VITBC|nr:unnamed protein product [Vitrella brassicaformis CCMP3155]|mmetsp:Transcript_827/g.1821  ORF Transcript_827/g.1821 Transcript_827/m.1821 type:complete len:904 (+) Transcript_827:178-2889(+)|eukprot:CEL96292.1 unnamed protein product [Vitrella brassicaformis CCMP3155]
MSDGRFFQTTKRGEIHELKEELHSANKDKKKEAVKKVIAAMTVGKDVSALFPDVVNCMQTSNIELKKLVYLYVINYAKAQPELAILAVNTFRKDSLDANPLIRALAVRTMGCIRLEQITEYLVEPLRRCCKDQDPYVRKTAAICIAKLYDISPELVEDQGFIDILKDMLSDGNPMVVANSVAALSEISESAGKNVLPMNENTISKLLAALNECTEWGQVFILDAIATHTPTSARDAESILERVTARLSHANAAVVMSAIKVVMRFLDRITNTETIRSLQRKLSPPLVTLLSAEPEIQYVALRNINLIVQRRPTILATEVKMFFCKYNDPVYVKMEKLDIMVRLASERNIDQILMELKEYATEVDVDFVRKSVRAIGRCAIKLDRAAERCINVLLDLIETRVNYVVQEAIVVIKDIFRKYPNRYESIISALCENLDSLDEPEAKASMIWIIGEYAERIDNADELLDSFLESFHDETPSVQLQILTATVKLFLKTPSSTQDMVTKVLKMSTEESENPDLRDRGYIYWRLLSSNPEATKQVVLADKPTISDDSYSLDSSVLDRLIDNIAMLSSVYHKLPEAFVTRLRTVQKGEYEDEEEEEEEEDKVARLRQEMKEGPAYESDEEDERDRDRDRDRDDESSGGEPTDLLGLDDTTTTTTPTAAAPTVPQQMVLNADQPGQKGQRGLKVAAALTRFRGSIVLQMTFGNMSQMPLSGWAIQFNKNPFGLAPGGPLQVQDLAPGQTATASLPVTPNQLLSNNPPAVPLILQVAVKTSLDVFYFNVPVDFGVLLVEDDSTDKDTFKDLWARIGEAKQVSVMAMAPQPLPSAQCIQTLAAVNIKLVAQRAADTFDSLYFSCTTTNRLVVLAEISLQKSGNGVKVVTRTEAGPLIPLFQAQVAKSLTLQRTG